MKLLIWIYDLFFTALVYPFRRR